MLFSIGNDRISGGDFVNKGKVTFKGQITIPKDVRKALAIKEGDS
ncbi:MAG: AbrB/MazE/SpoVT family DNA-binding domain-containing protein, partial [Thermodesulfobacteriota bacterium]